MQPQVTIKTSQPFQRDIIKEHDSEEDMDEIQGYRDQLVDQLSQNIDALGALEELSGLEFIKMSLDIWVYRGGDKAISSPLLLPERSSPNAGLLELLHLVSKDLIYENKIDLKEHEMLEAGTEKLDVTAGMLAYRAMEEEATQRDIEEALNKKPFTEQEKTWSIVREKVGEWKEKDETLLEFLGIEMKEQEEPV